MDLMDGISVTLTDIMLGVYSKAAARIYSYIRTCTLLQIVTSYHHDTYLLALHCLLLC